MTTFKDWSSKLFVCHTSKLYPFDILKLLFSFLLSFTAFLIYPWVSHKMDTVDLDNVTMNSSGNSSCLIRYTLHSTILLGFITPVIIIFGLIANVLNFKIFSHKLMRTSLLNWYLAFLSLSDIMVLLTGFFFISLPRIGEYFDKFYLVNFANTIVLVSYPVANVAQTCSVWLTIAMSAHRFVGVCLPFKAARICSKRNCRLAIIFVLIFSLLFNVTRFCELKLAECYAEELDYLLITPNITELRDWDMYRHVYMVWCCSIVMFFLPFILLIALNTAVILAIQNTTKLHQSLGSDYSVSKKREIAKEVSTSIMLVGVVVVFLVCNTLAFVANVLEMVDTYRTQDDKDRFGESNFYKIMVDASNMLVMLNAAINIFVYCSFSQRFRLLLNHYISLGCFREVQPLIDSVTVAAHWLHLFTIDDISYFQDIFSWNKNKYSFSFNIDDSMSEWIIAN